MQVDPAKLVEGYKADEEKVRMDLLSPIALAEIGKVMTFGAAKYDDNNWRRGYKWSLSSDAHDRHYHAWRLGEDLDEETGSHHLIAAAWHLIALWWFQKWGKGSDDIRPTIQHRTEIT